MNAHDDQISLGLLVTGDFGFVGRHALLRWPDATGLSTITGGLDIRNKKDMQIFFRKYRPKQVLHLAAQSFVPDSFRIPEATFDVNFFGTLRLLECLAESGFKGRFLYIGTGDAYGIVPESLLPITEELPLRPRNPYAVSKVAAEALCFQWSQTASFEIVMARPFNHLGPGQAPAFAISDFARQVAEIACGQRPPLLNVGNIDVSRDFTDVADILDAYGLLLENGHNGEIYNVCSGVERSVRSVLERLLHLTGIHAEILTDPSRFRPSDQSRVCGSHEKLSQHTGWRPKVPIDQTLLSLYSYWEHEIGK